ncbi:hypothetical protein FS837_001690, partial [Tulasnella sp. UAMH 9824]
MSSQAIASPRTLHPPIPPNKLRFLPPTELAHLPFPVPSLKLICLILLPIEAGVGGTAAAPSSPTITERMELPPPAVVGRLVLLVLLQFSKSAFNRAGSMILALTAPRGGELDMDGVGGEELFAEGSVIGDGGGSGGCDEGACEENDNAKEWDGESGGCDPGPVIGDWAAEVVRERFFVGGDLRGLVGGDLEGDEDVVGVVGENGGEVEADEGDGAVNCGGPDGIVSADVALGVVVMSVGTAVVVELLFSFFGVAFFLSTGMAELAVLRLRISPPSRRVPNEVLGLPASPTSFPSPNFSPRMPAAVPGRPEDAFEVAV